MNDKNDLEMQIVCLFSDAIKFTSQDGFCLYVPLTKDIVEEFQNACLKMDIKISHGYCPDCYKRETEKIKSDLRHEKYLAKAREYFRV